MSFRVRRVLCICAVTALLCFIWGNSLLSGEQSGELSGGLLQWLTVTFPFLTGMPELLLRKLGHFSEFAALGFFLCWLLRLGGERGIHRLSVPLFLGMLAANIDETIQVFRPGRGPSVIDVWIDTAGTAAGIAAFFLFHAVHTQIQKGKHK